MSYRPAIASMSLGRAWVHDFHKKVRLAAEAGFEGIEIFYEDLEYLAKKHAPAGTTPSEAALISAAQDIRALCDELKFTIIGLQPFIFYEGLTNRKEHQAKIEKLKVWFKLVKILGTDIIQIPTQFQSSGTTGDMDVIVADLREVADLGLQEQPPVKFAYENLCWGKYIDTWEGLWDVVMKVDRPNFGCCLDTFNIAGRVWADPAAEASTVEDADARLKASMEHLVKTVDVNKVFYVQVVDAERMSPPLTRGHPFYGQEQPARMSWSRNARLFMYEQEKGGYLPVEDVARAILVDLGYKGWVSMELFSRTMAEPGGEVPRQHAQRGIASWKKLVEALQLK
jgi:4-hydroxyphenylpyruvate dioxygenase